MGVATTSAAGIVALSDASGPIVHVTFVVVADGE
jgi:hypothetical protein